MDANAADVDGSFKYRSVEDETRHEIEREVNILKARAKLQERKRQEGDGGGS